MNVIVALEIDQTIKLSAPNPKSHYRVKLGWSRPGTRINSWETGGLAKYYWICVF